MKISCLLLMLTFLCFGCGEELPLKQKIGDRATGQRWIYDDWPAAQAKSIETGKPIFTVFRCVP